MLLEACWPGQAQVDNQVHKVIAGLRRAMQDNAAKPTYIETIRKQGETIEAMKKMAAPPPRLHVVEKSGEISITNASTDTKTVEAEFAKLSQEDKALLMVKLAQSNPQKMGSVG